MIKLESRKKDPYKMSRARAGINECKAEKPNKLFAYFICRIKGENTIDCFSPLQVRVYIGPGLFRRFARLVDRLITKVQEWLEAPDTVREKAVVYIILALAGIYLAGHLIVFLFR